MGLLRVQLGLANPFQPERKISLEVLVDTGALLSIIPAERLRELGVEPRERRTFKLADGREIEREVGEVQFEYDGYEGTSKVVFGQKGDAVVMGVLALETLGLEVDPVRGQLRPATLRFSLLAGHGFSRAEQAGISRGFSP